MHASHSTIISHTAFIVLGTIFILKNKMVGISFLVIGVAIEAGGVIGEIKGETKKSKK